MRLSRAFCTLFALATTFGTAILANEQATVNEVVSDGKVLEETETETKIVKKIPASEYVVDMDKETFLNTLKGNSEMILEFYADWCEACHYIAPTYSEFAEAVYATKPNLVVGRVDITKIEYLASCFMVDKLPDVVYIRRPAPGVTPEVRYTSINITMDDLMDYVNGGWEKDTPVGGVSSFWCTPVNACGHLGGLIGEGVVYLDHTFNRFNMPPWSFMAIVVTLIYAVGQVLIVMIGKLTRKLYRKNLYKKYENAPNIVPFNEKNADGKGKVSSAPKSSKSSKKGSRSKKSKRD